MSSLRSAELGKIDDVSKCLVFRYIRQIDINDMIIPDAIIILCLSYYFINEFFCDLDGVDIELADDNNTLIKKSTICGGWRNMCYGSKIIDSFHTKGIFKWIIQVNSTKSNVYYIIML